MLRINRGAERAGRGRANRVAGVRTTGRAGRDQVRGVQLDVRGEVRGHRETGTGRFALFQRVLVGRRVQLAEVVDAGIGLRGGTGLHEVRNRDRRQQADDGHDNHDFNQRETRSADVFVRFHVLLFLFHGVGAQPAWLYISTALPTGLPVATVLVALLSNLAARLSKTAVRLCPIFL